ncbi:hypothetical protein BDK51DRAFT_53191 [Blyttiomyces helicus]|uniref:Ankyrin repeat-containing domain protein n=1 Tax=Blyttiomyces helicus TaxID=388810 RepID=A0A4P9VVF7_9FUNG|nr:hypothetical protein BDK51DRAFT_53191 [Blyttiomyces helicus]|eukprot:RKO83629.1 hypothetical protein BDK51DRAFT_53191 [Blyttiomyces helicus]
MPLTLPNETIDQILEHAPPRIAVSLRRSAVLRKHILAGNLEIPIQRALNRLDVDALQFFARVCPAWKSTNAEWYSLGEGISVPGWEPLDLDYENDGAEWGSEGGEGGGDGEEEEKESESGENVVEEVEQEEEELHQLRPVPAAIIRNRWDAVRFFVDAGCTTKYVVDITIAYDAKLEDISYLLDLGHEDIFTPNAITTAVYYNKVPLVRRFHQQGFSVISNYVMSNSCLKGWLDMVSLLLEIGAPSLNRIGDFAVKLLHDASIPNAFTTHAMNFAAKDSLDIVEFLHKSRKEGCTTNAMDVANRMGYIDIVQFLHKHRREGCTTRAMDLASRGGHIEVVKFLHYNRREECTSRAMDYACRTWASSSRIARDGPERKKERHAKKCERAKEIVFFLHRHRIEGCTGDAMESACKHGCAELVRFLLPIRPARERRRALDLAVQRGHVEILRVLYEGGERFKDEEVKRIALRWRKGVAEGGVEAFLRGMHGMSRVSLASSARAIGWLIRRGRKEPLIYGRM